MATMGGQSAAGEEVRSTREKQRERSGDREEEERQVRGEERQGTGRSGEEVTRRGENREKDEKKVMVGREIKEDTKGRKVSRKTYVPMKRTWK